MKNRRSPIEVAKALLSQKLPDFSVAFVGGSFNRGEETATSDIDLVVVMPHVDRAWRESLIFEEWPVELLVHDVETLKYFFFEMDAKDGIPSLPQMVFEGPAIPETSPISKELKDMARNLIDKGPAPLSEDEGRNHRYAISDLLDDLRAPRTSFEGMVTAGKLHGLLAFFLFRSNGTWAAATKHIPRRMHKLYPELHLKWEAAFTQAFAGNFKPVIQLTEDILKEHGGYLFDGYHQPAPIEWRLK